MKQNNEEFVCAEFCQKNIFIKILIDKYAVETYSLTVIQSLINIIYPEQFNKLFKYFEFIYTVFQNLFTDFIRRFWN